MPTFVSHAITGAAVAAGSFPLRGTGTVIFLSVLCSVIPDIDVLAFYFGFPYGHFLGHRGFSHSLAFACLWALLVSAPLFAGEPWRRRVRIFACFFAATALHSLLDAMTSGGLGVAFFSPFDTTRYFLPWRPIRVSPIGLEAFFSRWGLEVIASEAKYVWIPSFIIMGIALAARSAVRGKKKRFALPREK
jgi:inner membrane protein